jgi:hypothetical protein
LLHFTSIEQLQAETTVFFKAVCFCPWLAGKFHNFELTQNREKIRNGLTQTYISKNIAMGINHTLF